MLSKTLLERLVAGPESSAAAAKTKRGYPDFKRGSRWLPPSTLPILPSKSDLLIVLHGPFAAELTYEVLILKN